MYDLIVIGSGPAGSSAARSAAKSGLKTLLLEKEKVPRNKLCGGGITPKVLKLLDFAWPDQVVECSCKSTRVHVGERLFTFHSEKPLVYMTSRSKFDTFLVEKAVEAGAQLEDATPAYQVEATNSSVKVKTSAGLFEARILIGADGMGGPTAGKAGIRGHWKPDQVSYAIESEVPVGERQVEDFVGSEQYFDLFFGVSPAGYGWVFPKDDHLTVGIGCRLSQLRNAHDLFNSFVRHVSELKGHEVPKPLAHLIPLGGVSKLDLVGNRVLLCGDSAGFAEPLLGEGIYFSILGGQLAAQTATVACRNEQFGKEFLTTYERRCDEAFGADFDFAFRVAKASYIDRYDMDGLAKFFFANRSFQECMMGLMDGSVRYRDMQVRLAWPYLKYRLSRMMQPFS